MKLVILPLIATAFGPFQVMANTDSDNNIEPPHVILAEQSDNIPDIALVENPICSMRLPKGISMKIIVKYPGLHELAAQSNNNFSRSDLTMMCQYIYVRELDIDAQDEDGNTALHIAAGNINSRAIKALLEAGADPTLTNNDGLTALDIAEEAKRKADEQYNNIHPVFRIIADTLIGWNNKRKTFADSFNQTIDE